MKDDMARAWGIAAFWCALLGLVWVLALIQCV